MADRASAPDHSVSTSHPEREYFPPHGGDEAITKGQVVDYYRRISDLMAPLIAGRPLVVQRFPKSIEAGGFYQKNAPSHMPDWIERVAFETADGGSTDYPVVNDPAVLPWFANQGAIVHHTLLVDAAAPGRPVEVIFDLDPSDDDLGPVRDAAHELRTVLDQLRLAPRVKTSGSRGLHIVVDVLDDEPDFGLTSSFARAVAESIVDRGDFTLEHRKNRRRGRLFLDIFRNGPASHAVAPYSLRPLPGAPVAAPLDWDEALGSDFHPRRITIANIFRRLAQKSDPWSLAPEPSSTIADALSQLSS